MRRIPFVLLLGAAVALLAGCGGSDLDMVGSWQLTSGEVDGNELAPTDGAPVTLDVDEDLRVSGQSACNVYEGSVEVDGGAVTFSPLASTLMACPEPLMDLETQYFAALAVVDAGSREGDVLTLTGGTVELVYEAQGGES